MSEFNKRIIEIADYYGIKRPSDFARKTGFSHQVASTYLKSSKNPSVKALEQIQLCFKNINPEWLLTGKGPMLRSVEGEGEKDVKAFQEHQTDQPTGMSVQGQGPVAYSSDSKEKDLIIEGLRNQVQSFEVRLTEKDKQIESLERQIEDLKNNLGMVIASKDEMLAMKEEAIKGKEATLAAKDETIRIQSKRIAELESHRETENLKKILGTSERIGQESTSLTDIHPKDPSTKAKKGEYKV